MITARKAHNQTKRDQRLKRGGGAVRGDSAFEKLTQNGEEDGIAGIIGREPSPEFAAEAAETYRQILLALDSPVLRDIVRWKMEGCTNQEIADWLSCSVRTVERKLRLSRQKLSEGVFDGPDSLKP